MTWDHQFHGSVGYMRNGKPFVCGGIYYNKNVAKICREFNFGFYMWEPTNISLIENRFNAKSVLLENGTFIVMGGLNVSRNTLNSMEILDQDKFLEGPYMPIHTSSHCVVKKDELIIITGGNNGDEIIDRSFIFNIINKEWEYPASMNTARFGHICGISNNVDIIVAGGKSEYNTRDILDSSEQLSLKSFHWQNIARLPKRIFGAITVQIESTFLVLGDGYKNFIFQFDEVNYEWVIREEKMAFMRHDHFAFEFSGKRCEIIP